MFLGLAELRHAPGRFVVLGVVLGLLVALMTALATIADRHVTDLTGKVATSPADLLVLDAAAQGALQASRIDDEAAAHVRQHAAGAELAPVGEQRMGARVADGELLDLSLWGLDPDSPAAPEVIAGRLPRQPGEAVLDVADRAQGAALGERLTLVDTGTVLEIVGFTAEARFGAIPTAAVTYDAWTEIAAEAADADPDEVEPTAMAVRADGGVEELAAALNGSSSPVQAAPPSSLASQLPGVAGVRASFGLLLGVAWMAVAAVAATFAVAGVAHRQRTIALLRAVGAPRRRLLAALTVQLLVVTAVGAVLAALLVVLAAWLAPADVPLRWEPGTWAASAAVALAATLMASAVAVVRLARVAPVDALGARR